MVTKGAVKDMMVSHSLHVSIVDGLMIIQTVVVKSLANSIGLPILPVLMLFPLHPQV